MKKKPGPGGMKQTTGAGSSGAKDEAAAKGTQPPQPGSEPGLEESAAALRAVVETAIDAIIVIDERGTVRSANPACARLFGYDLDEIVGRNVNTLMPSPDREQHDGYLARYRETGAKSIIGIGREVVGRRRDGSEVRSHLAVTEFHVGPRRLFAGILRDLTEVKEAEAVLCTRVEQLQTVSELGVQALAGSTLDQLSERLVTGVRLTLKADVCGVFELRGDGKSLLLSTGSGWPVDAVGSATLEAEDGSEAAYACQLGEPLFVNATEGDVRFRQSPVLAAHGVASRLAVVVFGAESLFGLLLVGSFEEREFSREDAMFLQGTANVLAAAVEGRRFQDQLMKQKSLAQLGEMSAVVAHEVKNPLAGIGGALRIIGDSLPAASTHRPVVTDILERLEELNAFVNEVLLFARPRPPHITAVPLRILLDDCVSLVENDPALKATEVILSGDDPTLHCDAELMRRAILNLLRNAAEATQEEGGVVTIEVSEGKLPGGGSRCEIVVADNGPGIPEAERSRVFEPFFSTKTTGTGLGLAIAKRIVEQHDGTLQAVAPKGKGSRFVVSLPG